MTVRETFLGYEDHGILTFYLTCEGNGNGVGVGGISLDAPPAESGGSRVPQASGLALITEVIRVADADTWEAVRGKHLLVLFEGTDAYSGRAVGVANPLTGKVLVFSEFLERTRQQTKD